MRTDDLIQMLARNAAPVDSHLLKKRFAVAWLIAAMSALLLVLVGLGVRADIATAIHTPLFWIKAALPATLILAALWMTTRLARPGVLAGASGWGVGAPIVAVWIGALYALSQAHTGDRLAMVLGQTWKVCPVLIALLSVPGLIAILWALRGLAPTRLKAAGASGGLLAGATATLAYCVHCPEMGVPFWACWYLLGMLVPTALGAVLGPRVLRW
jgi:hypothetical protein